MAKAIQEEMTTLDLSKVPDPPEKVQPADELQIDIIDDTPPADRHASPPMELPPEPDEDEVASYSSRVKQRIEKLTKAYHDERRSKEAADRERQEALRYAQSVMEKNKTLVQTTNSNSTLLHETWKSKAETDLAHAKQQYKIAYETGDSEKIVDAQEALNRATMRHEMSKNQAPALQKEEEGVKPQHQDSVYTAPKDERAEAWAKENSWFGKDRLMTSLAYGLHEELVESGLHPQRDAKAYYAKINEGMQALPRIRVGRPTARGQASPKDDHDDSGRAGYANRHRKESFADADSGRYRQAFKHTPYGVCQTGCGIERRR